MRRFVPFIILLPLLFACGKEEESTAPPTPDQPAPAPATLAPPTPDQSAPAPATPAPPTPDQPAPAPATPAPAPESIAPTNEKAKLTPNKYTVVKGDTLYSIAKKNGMNYNDLTKWNNIKNPRQIRVGQELKLTAPSP